MLADVYSNAFMVQDLKTNQKANSTAGKSHSSSLLSRWFPPASAPAAGKAPVATVSLYPSAMNLSLSQLLSYEP